MKYTYSFLSLILVSFLTILSITTFSQTAIKVNQQRIENRIFELAKFGKDSIGKGYRVAYTKGDIEGRTWFIDKMGKAGLAGVASLVTQDTGRENKARLRIIMSPAHYFNQLLISPALFQNDTLSILIHRSILVIDHKIYPFVLNRYRSALKA